MIIIVRAVLPFAGISYSKSRTPYKPQYYKEGNATFLQTPKWLHIVPKFRGSNANTIR